MVPSEYVISGFHCEEVLCLRYCFALNKALSIGSGDEFLYYDCKPARNGNKA